MLRDDEHLYVDVDTGGYIFFGTPRRLRNIIGNPINNPIWSLINNPKYSPINNPKYNPIKAAKRKQGRLDEAKAYLHIKGVGGVLEDEEILTNFNKWVVK